MSYDVECLRGLVRAPDDVAPPEHRPLLPPEEVPKGNVRLYKAGKRAKIHSTSQAAKLKTGRRDQVPGLVYDPSQPGCDPRTWRVVCDEHETRRLCAHSPPTMDAERAQCLHANRCAHCALAARDAARDSNLVNLDGVGL
jgi:hypothetical protein